ncbi:MAG: 6-phosphogluconolactonase [Tannerellaceae bacterium]|nr:6-phosphogluconolactonase [Tannerellaceae bacterium]
MKIQSYKDKETALNALTADLIRLMEKKKGVFNLALSGGETAKQMFYLWCCDYRDRVQWDRIRFFWVDERCVPPFDPESNYGSADKYLFRPLVISMFQIHRIKGEEIPEIEAVRYAKEVEQYLPVKNGLPQWDCILLGVGPDAHTASIFPSTMELLTDTRTYAVSQHPESGQHRITLTGPVLLNDTPLLVPVLGKDKQTVVKRLKKGWSEADPTPATYILSKAKDAVLYITE